MPHQKPKVICPKCSHEFEIGGSSKQCWWCNKPFTGKGNRRYCSMKCKTRASNWRQWKRLKSDALYVAGKRVYMREYMREYMRKRRPA